MIKFHLTKRIHDVKAREVDCGVVEVTSGGSPMSTCLYAWNQDARSRNEEPVDAIWYPTVIFTSGGIRVMGHESSLAQSNRAAEWLLTEAKESA